MIHGHKRPCRFSTTPDAVEVCRRISTGYYGASKNCKEAARDAAQAVDGIVHLATTREGNLCGIEGKSEADINDVTCPTCSADHEKIIDENNPRTEDGSLPDPRGPKPLEDRTMDCGNCGTFLPPFSELGESHCPSCHLVHTEK